jgi:hypothetical protein
MSEHLEKKIEYLKFLLIEECILAISSLILVILLLYLFSTIEIVRYIMLSIFLILSSYFAYHIIALSARIKNCYIHLLKSMKECEYKDRIYN